MSHECDKCGEEFDTERGLHIHQSQSHKEDEKEQESSENNQIESEDRENLSIGLKPAMLGVFALGLFVGLSSGLMFSQLTLDQNTVNNVDSPADSDGSDSQISGASTTEALKDIASSVDVDAQKLEEHLDDSDSSEINEDISKIQNVVGQLGTPTFFIGNSEIGYAKIEGAQPYSRMKSTIDQKINEAENGDTTIGSEEYTLGNITFEGEPKFGDNSAKINIIEYSDYGCPWCAEWHGVNAINQRNIDEEDSFNKVQSNYVETGEVQFVMKDYPVAQLHPKAETAHQAANYVWNNKPKSFKEFSQKLYQEREKWR